MTITDYFKDDEMKRKIIMEVSKILITAVITSIATCSVWTVQTRSENERQDKYKKMELVQEYAKDVMAFENLRQCIIDNKQLWIYETLRVEYNSQKAGDSSAISNLDKYEQAEKEYRAQYNELVAHFYSILFSMDLLFDFDDVDEQRLFKIYSNLADGFGFKYEDYRKYFWDYVQENGGFISEKMFSDIIDEIDEMIEKDTSSTFFEEATAFIIEIKKAV